MDKKLGQGLGGGGRHFSSWHGLPPSFLAFSPLTSLPDLLWLKKNNKKIRDCSQSNKKVRERVFVTWDDCLLKVIQRTKHVKERNLLAFSMQNFISYHSYKSLILDSLFNRFLIRINSFLVAFQGPSKVVSAYCRTYWTKMYPKALMCWSPLSAPWVAWLPHVLESSWCPPVPKPILESALAQSFCSFPMIPILALLCPVLAPMALNPSLLQLGCNEAREPMSVFHVLRPSEVARYLPSAISEDRDLAWCLMTTDLNCWPIFIPRQILSNGVFQ